VKKLVRDLPTVLNNNRGVGIPIDKKLLSTINKLIDKSFSIVLFTIQLLIRQPSYQPTIDNETQIINSW
jgi:hypothetical protein